MQTKLTIWNLGWHFDLTNTQYSVILSFSQSQLGKTKESKLNCNINQAYENCWKIWIMSYQFFFCGQKCKGVVWGWVLISESPYHTSPRHISLKGDSVSKPEMEQLFFCKSFPQSILPFPPSQVGLQPL